MYRILVFITLLLWSISYGGYTQQNKIIFHHLTIDDGISQNSINCIYQDKNGFMWFGTQDGLNRYDGYQFIHYKNDRNNINSISNNYIFDIYEDDEGVLWIATFGGGLNSLNPVTGKITRFEMISEDSVSIPVNRMFSITESPKGILWIGSNEGLIRFDKKTKKSKLFLAQKKTGDTYDDNYVGVVVADNTNNLWLQSDSGLTRFNTKSFEVAYFRRSPYSNSIELLNVKDIKHTNNALYITCKAGFVEINFKEKTDDLMLPTFAVQPGEQSPLFQKIVFLHKDQYAIGTNKGLIIFDSKTNKFSLNRTDVANEKTLTHNNILSLLKSNDGVLWVGTRNGLNKNETRNPNFLHIRNIPGSYGLSAKNVTSFMKEHDSLLWIGTNNGLNLYNENNNKIQVFKKNAIKNNSLLTDYILCQFIDSKNNKWIGTRRGGFYKVEYNSNSEIEFKHIRPANDTTSAISVHFITESKDGSLWIGTGGAGLWKYNPTENTVKKYSSAKNGTGPNHPYIFVILEDQFQNLWLGTPSGGLNLFNPRTEKFIYFQNKPKNDNSISNDIILSLHINKQNELWIGTNNGVNKLIPKLNSNIFSELKSSKENGLDSLFKNYGIYQGFPNNVIYGMLEDNHQNLWITTNKGLAVFDMVKERVIKTFDVSDGLQSNEFNQNAYLKSNAGKFYIGGVNGVNIFSPDSIKSNEFIPPVVLTNFSLFNKKVELGIDTTGNDFKLDKAIYLLDGLNLSWKHNVFTFEFAALSYVSPEKNNYSYMLEGFNKNWVGAGTGRSATYTHLDPGNYTFKVRASNNSGLWNETGTELKLNISTPPWLSWYAYLIYFILIFSAIYAFIRYRINMATREIKIQNQIENARVQERENFRKKSAADFHDEAGNKITKITLFTELAKAEINNKVQLEYYLSKIQLNITNLSVGMRDFLWVMDSQNDTLFETISRLKDFGDSTLTETGILFTINGIKSSFQTIDLPMNARRNILQIFKEAINNCAKHAEADKVSLTTIISDKTINISLSDNGKGFVNTENHLKNKYGLSIMVDRAKKIDAELIIDSIKKKGTTISLKYNMPQMGNS